MSYTIFVLPKVRQQIRKQAQYYQEQFNSGAKDFTSAIRDTYHRLLPFPESHSKVSNFDDETIRCIRVKANKGRRNYAKDFPFQLIYKIYETKQEIVIYQLWPEKSDISIDKME